MGTLLRPGKKSGARRFRVVAWSAAFSRRCRGCSRWRSAGDYTIMPDNKPPKSYLCNGCVRRQHLIRSWRNGRKIDLRRIYTSPKRSKVCTKCERWLPFDSFNGDYCVGEGLRAACKACTPSTYDSTRHREKHLRVKYGLTQADYEEMAQGQGYRCVICGLEATSSTSLKVDHCHDSGCIRGLLCHKCNAGLGHFDDDSVRLLAAANYVLETRQKSVANARYAPLKQQGGCV